MYKANALEKKVGVLVRSWLFFFYWGEGACIKLCAEDTLKKIMNLIMKVDR